MAFHVTGPPFILELGNLGLVESLRDVLDNGSRPR
jgi:hypothetical protein